MKKNKKEKLQFEKFSVTELNNLQSIKGGGNDLPTGTIDLTVILTGNAGNQGNAGGGGSSIQCGG